MAKINLTNLDEDNQVNAGASKIGMRKHAMTNLEGDRYYRDDAREESLSERSDKSKRVSRKHNEIKAYKKRELDEIQKEHEEALEESLEQF